jgi:NAD(P)H dehydrogenase (quinone)
LYVITGITGKVGGAVARTLLDENLPVRAVVRDAGKGAIWHAQGCEVVLADIADPAALAAAFDGAEGVFVLIPPMFDPTPGFQPFVVPLENFLSATHSAQAAEGTP